MVRIEELPNTTPTTSPKPPSTSTKPLLSDPNSVPFPLASSANLTSNGNSTSDNTTPDLPPVLSSIRSQPLPDLIAQLNRHPLFMTHLDPTDDNPSLEALRALAYEGSPHEIATNFKQQGNESFATSSYRDAIEHYTKGLTALASARQKRLHREPIEGLSDGADTELERSRERQLEETLFVNRSEAHLKLSNNRSARADAVSALRLNPLNKKAHHRHARALLGMSRPGDALAALAISLRLFPADPTFETLRSKAQTLDTQVAAKERAQRDREAARELERQTLAAALRARGIRTRTTTPDPPDLEDATIRLLPDPADLQSILHFPVLLLYPLADQSDFIKAQPENEGLSEVLAEVLGSLPWDTDGLYRDMAGVECFMDTRDGGLVRVGKKVPLGVVLGGKKGEGSRVEVVDGVVRVMVVLKGEVEGWVQSVKKSRGK
ncbi:MAG: hypothetical protein M1824_006113 [Vezdaea acicularis]|nr:MAG: hypothetical protein M1824_006113 [Vezdaea acicularis]